MKKLLIAIAVVTGVIVAQGVWAVTGTLSLTPASRPVRVGESFTVNVSVNPSAGAVYTVKSQVSFPAALVEVTGFTYASTWLPLTQSGYDSTDNTAGVLIKSAGYPGGTSSAVNLGTITFRAKATGSGAITIGNQSMILDASSNNVFTPSSSQTGVTVTAGTGGSSPTPTVSRAPTPRVSAAVSPRVTVTPSPTTSPLVSGSPTLSPTASPSTANILGVAPRTWGILGAVLVALLTAYALLKPRQSA